MKVKKILGLITVGAVSLLCLQGECGNDPEEGVLHSTEASCPAGLVDSMVLLYPNGGETFTVGDRVEIKWCLPSNWPYDQSRIKIDLTGRELYNDLTGLPIDKPTNTYVWKVTDEYVGSSVKIMVTDYGESIGVGDASDGSFSVVAK